MNPIYYMVGDVLPVEPRPQPFHSGKYDRWSVSTAQEWVVIETRPYEARAMASERWPDCEYLLQQVAGPPATPEPVRLSSYDCFTDKPDPVRRVRVKVGYAIIEVEEAS